VISDIDISDMYAHHLKNNSLVTLAVNDRETTRPLLFDENNNLSGYVSNNNTFNNSEKSNKIKKGFCGVHILSSVIFNLFPPEDKFDIIPAYSKIALEKFITFYDVGDTYWKDLGKYEDFI